MFKKMLVKNQIPFFPTIISVNSKCILFALCHPIAHILTMTCSVPYIFYSKNDIMIIKSPYRHLRTCRDPLSILNAN